MSWRTRSMAGDWPIEGFGLLDELVALGGVFDGDEESVEVEGFLDEVVGSAVEGVDGGVDGAVGGDDDEGDVGGHVLGSLEDVDAVHAGHFDVAEDEVGAVVFEGGESLDAVGGGGDLVALVAEDFLEGVAYAFLVVDY